MANDLIVLEPQPDLADNRNERLDSAYRRQSKLEESLLMYRTILAVVFLCSLSWLLNSCDKHERSRPFYDGANRCQTLELMAEAAHANLENAADEKTAIAVNSIEFALKSCSKEELMESRQDEDD